jgi:hypothetical protein
LVSGMGDNGGAVEGGSDAASRIIGHGGFRAWAQKRAKE